MEKKPVVPKEKASEKTEIQVTSANTAPPSDDSEEVFDTTEERGEEFKDDYGSMKTASLGADQEFQAGFPINCFFPLFTIEFRNHVLSIFPQV